MMRLVVPIAFAIVVVSVHRADAIPRDSCPANTSWDVAAGACVKKKAAPRLSAQARFERASADVDGTGKHPDPKRGLAQLEQLCDRDHHGGACRLLGFLYMRGRAPAVKDDRKAAEYLGRGCDLKELQACVDMGDLAYRIGQYPRARSAFRNGCDLGNGVACVRYTHMMDEGVGGPKDPTTATTWYRTSMAKLQPLCPPSGWADGLACAWIGWMYENGKGVTKDLPRALAAFRAGCTTGQGDACLGLGRALDEGYSGAADRDGANRAYDRACTDFDNSEACQKIAERLGMAKVDLNRAVKLAERACDLDAKYCGTLAEFYRLGFGLPGKDQTKATQLYQRACDNGGLGWCQKFAERTHDGVGTRPDEVAAINALEKACLARYYHSCGIGARYLIGRGEEVRAAKLAVQGCDDDDGDSCFRIGWLSREGRGGRDKDAAAAFKLFEKSCKLESPIGCNALANAYKDGVGTIKDLGKAVETFDKACEGNETELFVDSCRQLAMMRYEGTGTAKNLKGALVSMMRACEYHADDTCGLLPRWLKESNGDRAALIKMLDATCDDEGYGEACVAKGELYAASESESERRQAYATFRSACADDVGAACVRQADLLSIGRGVSKDVEKAEQLYRKVCDAEVQAACTQLGNLLLTQRKGEQAHPLFKRACEAKVADGCNGLGFQYFTANGVTWDITKAVEYFTKACDLGSLSGCANVGELYRYGSGTPQDHKKAFTFYEKACQVPAQASGCASYGHYLATGEGGTTVDKAKAEQVLRFACLDDELHHPEACEQLAALLESESKGSPAELARLRTMAFSRATALAKTNPSYMYLLGTYHRDGMATVKDPAKALDAFAKACEGFDPLGCVNAGRALVASGKPGDAERARAYFERACAAGVDDGCAGTKMKPGGPKAVTPGHGCCSGDVAPGAEAGTIILLWALGSARRRRRQRRGATKH